VFGCYLALIALALLGMALVVGVTTFKGRWVLPLLAPVPLMAFALRPGLDADRRGQWFTGLALALALLVLVAVGARSVLTYFDGNTDELNHPAARLGQALQSAGYDGRGRIIAADAVLAGMLRTRFHGASAAYCRAEQANVAECVARQVQIAGRAGQGWLLISRADAAPPGWLDQTLAHIPDGGRLPRKNLRIPFHLARSDHEPASYDFVWHFAQQP
jgi:hypothetical protein